MSMYGKIRSMKTKTISKIELKDDVISSSIQLENVKPESDCNESESTGRIEADITDQSNIDKLIKRGVNG